MDSTGFCTGLRCLTEHAGEVLKAATPIAAIAGVAACVVSYINRKSMWNDRMMHHCREIDMQRVNLNALIIGATALATLFTAIHAVAVSSLVIAGICGTIWLSAGAAVLLNTRLNHSLTQARFDQMM